MKNLAIHIPPQQGPAGWSATAHRTTDAIQVQNRLTGLWEKLYAPFKIAAVYQVAHQAGLQDADILSGTGLVPAQLDNFQTRVSIQQLLAVARNIARLAPQSGLGFQAGLRMRPSAYGMYGYAMLCAQTMREGFEVCLRFHALATRVLPLHWEPEGDSARWHIGAHADVAHLDLDQEQYRFFVEMQVAIIATLVRDVMGDWCSPAHVGLMLPEPSYAAQMQNALQCPLAFHSSHNTIDYPLAWLERAPALANPISAGLMSQACARMMDEHRWQTGFSQRVVAELTRTPGRFPSMEEIACAQSMTARTLRRKLQAEGATYDSLLASVRQALARDYLQTRHLSTKEVAEALGFGDTAAFRHAFKRWTGLTPAEFLRQQETGQATAAQAQQSQVR